ncbi:hypothetical protein M0813_09187 [Anaeramoeba flamelloides]|uniref:Uncharacterized protein n=1 Tax=Anaeramoeba flamelloides TaxID=1746091 RepID=A0ABQ8X7I3_9EUKA|nr:hypothetical protein M0813_09187 [Anaeramoeba flamelloides]
MDIYSTNISVGEKRNQGYTRLTDLKRLVKSLDPKIKINTNTNTITSTGTEQQTPKKGNNKPNSFITISSKSMINPPNTSSPLHLSTGFSFEEKEEMILDNRFGETKNKNFIPNNLKKKRKTRKPHKRNKFKFFTQDNLPEEY